MADETPPAELVPLESLPGLARIAAGSALNTAEWSLAMWVRTTRRLLAAARDPEQAQALARELGLAAGGVVRLLDEVAAGTPVPVALARLTEPEEQITDDQRHAREAAALREKGQALLARSRDVTDLDDTHPAYDRILEELAPDEARILVLLATGPQPSVDVRTGGPVGMVSSELVAPGLTMIGARAGVRYAADVPSYLNNLFRLGLVWFSREQLHDPTAYQVLEAQPDVLEAMRSVTFAKVVRRSIRLTPFGDDFVRATLADGPSEAP
ncbi:MAG TPA: Abi-alpha family protein [Nocardioides sp.]|nr:Abi-alpha family protein [Nocardioides sp.]